MSSLSNTAIRVVKASRKLDDIDKLVWIEIYHLDQGPEGCYMRPDVLAGRVGRSRATMERSRRRLKECALLRSVHRRGYCDSWYVDLPSECVLSSSRPSDQEVFTAAARLDEMLAQPGGGGVAKILADLAAHMQPGSTQPGVTHDTNLASPTPKPGGTGDADKREQNSTEVSTEGENELLNKPTQEQIGNPPPNWIRDAKQLATRIEREEQACLRTHQPTPLGSATD